LDTGDKDMWVSHRITSVRRDLQSSSSPTLYSTQVQRKQV